MGPMTLIKEAKKQAPYPQWGEEIFVTAVFAIIICASTGVILVNFLTPRCLNKVGRAAPVAHPAVPGRACLACVRPRSPSTPPDCRAHVGGDCAREAWTLPASALQNLASVFSDHPPQLLLLSTEMFSDDAALGGPELITVLGIDVSHMSLPTDVR